MGPGLRVHQISRPHCGASHPCHCAWLAWAHSLLRRGKEPLPQHSLHPIRSARALPASSLTQPSWRTAHKLKNISFQQTSLLRIQALSFSSRGELFISLPKKKKTQNLKPQTEKQVEPFQDLAEVCLRADKGQSVVSGQHSSELAARQGSTLSPNKMTPQGLALYREISGQS